MNIRALLHRDEPEHNRRRTDPGFEGPELTEEQQHKAGRLTGRHRRAYLDDVDTAGAQDHFRQLREPDS